MDMSDPKKCKVNEYYMDYLLGELELEVKRKKTKLDMKQIDLVLQPRVVDDVDFFVGCYYFANHRDKCLFWLNDFDARDILSDCDGVENLSHIRGWLIVLNGSGFDDSSWFS